MADPEPPRFRDHGAHVAALCAAALRAVDPAEAVRRNLSVKDVSEAERVWVVGAGKAGVAMARAAAEILGERVSAGVIAVPHAPEIAPKRITFIEGGHPLPTVGSLAAGQAIAHLLEQATARDVVIALISGGGSALLELPRPGLTLADLQITNNQLLRCGAKIHDINIVRGALSHIKRGGLARLAHPARVISLILSDVVGNPLHLIASGPTSTDLTEKTLTDGTDSPAWAVVTQYNLQNTLPRAILDVLSASSVQSFSSSAQSVDNRLIASNRLAGEAAAEAARVLGFDAHYLGDDWQGEAREVGARFAQTCLSVTQAARPACLIAGGESTVTVRGHGVGGRNQEAALAAAVAIESLSNIVISSFATDGVDGPTDAAGAVVTGETVTRARAIGLNPQAYLENNDAYTFFATLNDLILTGPTGTNVNDLLLGLVY